MAGLPGRSVGHDGRTMRPAPVWLTVDEAAEWLNLPLAEVYEAITANRLPAQPHDRSYLVRRADVVAYGRDRPVATA